MKRKLMIIMLAAMLMAASASGRRASDVSRASAEIPISMSCILISAINDLSSITAV